MGTAVLVQSDHVGGVAANAMASYLVIIARDRPELLGTLAVIYGQKGEVETHFDRRQAQPGTGRADRPDRRTPTSP